MQTHSERGIEQVEAEQVGADQESSALDPVFTAEQEHLTKTHDKLSALARELVVKMQRAERQAVEDRQAMAEELSVDLTSWDEAMETYADFNAANRLVKAYNDSRDADAQKLSDLHLLLHQPYFAKVVLQYKPGDAPREFYIGTAGMSDENCRRMVVDWRSPVAEVYYNQANGPTSYAANGRVINVDLKLRRQFDIEGARLNAYFDTTVAIQDALLLESLSKRRTSQMKAITATIQREQNMVVRHEDVPALLVSGIAGSGKTSVLMQRIAYLFYQYRDSLDAREVFLITPNPLFRHYIENVLPDLGERNPEILTWDEFATGLLPTGHSSRKCVTSLDDLRRIDRAMESFAFEAGDFKDLRDHGVRFVSAAQIEQLIAKYRHLPAGPHVVTLVREELMKRVENRLKQMAASEEMQDEVADLDVNEQLRLFGETLDPTDEQAASRCALAYLNERHAGVVEAVKRDEWLRIDRIGMRVLGSESLESMTWLYLKMALTGLGNADAKYVMVDEVQDYTPAQLKVLARYFRRAHFLLLGDENQAIAEGTATFDEVRSILREEVGEVSECQLMTSYRSTPQITSLFAGLLKHDDRVRISSVQREEEAPCVIECEDGAAWEQALRATVEQARREDAGLTAVIVPWKSEARRVMGVLAGAGVGAASSADDPQMADADEASSAANAQAPSADDPLVKLLGKGDTLPDRGVVVLTLELAKGLEFDHVIVADASEHAFPTSGGRIARNRLYTTISRATRKATLLARGRLTSLLKHSVS